MVREEPFLRNQQLVPPIAHETTEIETPTIEAYSASVLEGELATRRRECASMSEALTSPSPKNQSIQVSKPDNFMKKKNLLNVIFCRKKYCRQVLFTDSILNLKHNNLITIEHGNEQPQSITWIHKLADTPKNQIFHYFKVELATARVFHKKGKYYTLMWNRS